MARKKRKKKAVSPAPERDFRGELVKYLDTLFEGKEYNIQVRPLWDDRYRVNCLVDNKMVRSHFIKFNESGVVESHPPLDKIGF